MREALAHQPGRPVALRKNESELETWIREQLQLGIDAAACGMVTDFDPEAIKTAGRARAN
ncbi:MAG: hypothetical protein WDZ48_03870 [Pirellulales bacterium]